MTVQPCSLPVPAGDGAGMPVSHQGYFGKAQWKSVLSSRGGFEHEDLLPCYCFQVYLFFFSLPFVFVPVGLCQAAGLESCCRPFSQASVRSSEQRQTGAVSFKAFKIHK